MEETNLQFHYNITEFSELFTFPIKEADSVGQEMINGATRDDRVATIALTIFEEREAADGFSQTAKSPIESTTERINNAEFSNYPVRSLIFILTKLRLKELFKEHVRDPRRRTGNYSIESLLTVGLFPFLFRSESKNDFYQNLYQGRSYKSFSRLAGIDQESFPVVKTLDDLFMILDPHDLEPLLFHLFKNLCRKKVFVRNKGKGFFLSLDAYCSHCYHEMSAHSPCPYCLKRERGDKVWYLPC